jgi:hypothetical protein
MAGVILGNGATPVAFSDGTVAATGEDETDAALLPYTVNHVTDADATVGVILPVASAGTIVDVYNEEASNGLLIYPPSGGTINGGSSDAAITIEGKSLAKFVCTNGTNWAAIYTADTP